MRSGSTGSPVIGSLTTRYRSAALRLTAEIRHDFGQTAGLERHETVVRHHAPCVRQAVARVAVGQVGGRAHVVGVDSAEWLLDLPAPARQQIVRRGRPVPVSQFHGRSGPLRPIHSPPPPSRQSATVSSSLDICSPTFRCCFPIHSRHGAESGRTAKGMTGYAELEFRIPTEHFMSSLTKVSSTTRVGHRAWIRRYARGVWRAAVDAGAYHLDRFTVSCGGFRLARRVHLWSRRRSGDRQADHRRGH